MNERIERGHDLIQRFYAAYQAALEYAAEVVIPYAGDAWFLQEIEGPIINIVVYADIHEEHRQALLDTLPTQDATFAAEYVIHPETQLYSRAFAVSRPNQPKFYVKVMVPKHVE